MRLRQMMVTLAFALIVGAAAPSDTSAYYFHGYKWPGGIVRYFNAATDQGWAVSQAVSAWNSSGAHIRFVAVPRSQAQLVISDPASKRYCTEGRASVGYVRDARVTLFPGRGLTHACNKYWAARVMAHELGHVLGLQHEDRYCAAMNAYGNLHGGQECEPKLLWAWRCRLLEPDDIAGVAAIYGGKPRTTRKQPLCFLYPGMSAPGHAHAEYLPDAGKVVISFTRPREPAIPAFVVPSSWRTRASFVILGPSKSCPTIDPLSSQVYHLTHWLWHGPPGHTETFPTPAVPGTNCYSVWALDKLGRPSAHPARVSVTVP